MEIKDGDEDDADVKKVFSIHLFSFSSQYFLKLY